MIDRFGWLRVNGTFVIIFFCMCLNVDSEICTSEVVSLSWSRVIIRHIYDVVITEMIVFRWLNLTMVSWSLLLKELLISIVMIMVNYSHDSMLNTPDINLSINTFSKITNTLKWKYSFHKRIQNHQTAEKLDHQNDIYSTPIHKQMNPQINAFT